MLVLQGKLRSVVQLGGHTNRKTGEVVPLRDVLQVETIDDRGLVNVETITVPDPTVWKPKIGQRVNVPVRAWASGAAVRFFFQELKPEVAA